MTKQPTVREELAALRESHKAFREAHAKDIQDIKDELAEILKQTKETNGTVRKHSEWIAGREPVCSQSLDNLKALTNCVTQITTQLNVERGEKKARARMATVFNAGLLLATAVASAWAGVQVAVQSLHP